VPKIVYKRGFTLFELIIVVFIIGLVYSVVTIGFNNLGKTAKLELHKIKPFLEKISDKRPLEFICYNDCRECSIFYNQKELEDIEVDLKLDSELEVFRIDKLGNFEKIDYGNRFINEKKDFQNVCLEFTLFKNSSSSKILVKNDEEYFIFPSYFGEVQRSFELDEAEKIFLDKDLYPSNRGDYYESF